MAASSVLPLSIQTPILSRTSVNGYEDSYNILLFLSMSDLKNRKKPHTFVDLFFQVGTKIDVDHYFLFLVDVSVLQYAVLAVVWFGLSQLWVKGNNASLECVPWGLLFNSPHEREQLRLSNSLYGHPNLSRSLKDVSASEAVCGMWEGKLKLLGI